MLVWRFKACRALALAAVLTVAAPALASPEDVFGFGVRSAGLGATGAASAEGYEAVYGNPALLSLARRRELSVGLMGATFHLRAGAALPYEPLRGALIGAAVPLPFGGVLRERVAIGLGFFTPFDRVVRGRILYPEKPQFLLADRTQSVAVQAALGLDLGYGVRLGGGFAALAALSGSVLVATGADGRVGTTVEDTLVASYGPIVGASVDLGDAYRVGATFRGKLEGRFNVVIRVRDLGSIVVPPLNVSGVAQYDPLQVAVEAARVKGPWRAAVGVTYKRWSAYPGPVEATVRCPPVDPDTGEPLEECGALTPPSVDYHDTLVPRLGVERIFEPSDEVVLRLRAGYFFEPTPAPAQSAASNHYDNSRSVFTLGYGTTLRGSLLPIDLDLFAQLHVLHPRTHEKDPEFAQGLAGSTAVSRGLIAAFGATAEVGF
jgi:long-chain fatty acid transport protein